MKKLSILMLMIFLSGCAGLQQAEQTKAQFHTYSTATPDAADKLLFSDEDSGHVIHTTFANDLPVGAATQALLDATINFGTEITLSADTTFDKDDGQSLIVNCTSDAELNPTGSFVEGFNIAIYNVGTNTILFDGAYTIQPGQYGMFSYDATNDEFAGGL